MKEFKGTPGPWFVSPKKNIEVTGDMNVIQTHGSNCNGYHIAYASSWADDPSTSIEASNNAKLIAAAPDLLEALQDVLSAWVDEDMADITDAEDNSLTKARAAINKALGGTK